MVNRLDMDERYSYYNVAHGDHQFRDTPHRRRPVPVYEADVEPEALRSLPIIAATPNHHSIQAKAESPNDEHDGAMDYYASLSISMVSDVAEHLLSHPLIVLRRTCQVSNTSCRYHHTPFTIIAVILRLNHCQGVSGLWRGFGSALIVRGLTLTAEDCMAKMTPWPKELRSQDMPLHQLGQHILLKAVALAIATPFYSASLVESVQSDIASEKPGIFDIFIEGFYRFFSGSTPRALPMWYLIPFSVAHGLAQYLVAVLAKPCCKSIFQLLSRRHQQAQGAIRKNDQVIAEYHDRLATITSHLLAEALLYPAETVLHRLHLQGSRTLIDNLDTGFEVLPVTTGYTGFGDCFMDIMDTEGAAGLFRGYGALILQYALQFGILYVSSTSVARIVHFIREESKPPMLLPPSSCRSDQSLQTHRH